MGSTFHFIIFKWKWNKIIRGIVKCFFSQFFVFQYYTCYGSVNCTMKKVLEFSAKLALMAKIHIHIFFCCECITENTVSILIWFTSQLFKYHLSHSYLLGFSWGDEGGGHVSYFSHKHRVFILRKLHLQLSSLLVCPEIMHSYFLLNQVFLKTLSDVLFAVMLLVIRIANQGLEIFYSWIRTLQKVE